MLKSKKFNKKKISDINEGTYLDSRSSRFMKIGFWLRAGIFILCFVFIVTFGGTLRSFARSSLQAIGYQTVKLVSMSLGDPMKTDINGNINILLVGIGGEGHAGSYLADSIIVASLDPENNIVSMISIPRDLYINYKGEYFQRINALFAWKYNHVKVPEGYDSAMVEKYKILESSTALAEKASDITGLEIPYYALVDFAGFENLIDTMGGIDIDVPYSIYDPNYPGPNNSYHTFSLPAGQQHLDGETALKYARSRKTTSDFSRSQRQQHIIEAIIKNLTKTENLTSVTTVKELYGQYKEIVTTNITARNMIAMIDQAYFTPKIFTFGYTTECSNLVWRTMPSGCLLYVPNRDDFDGMATMLPIGGSKSDISFYDYTAYFSYIVAHKGGFLPENAQIEILNGINDDYAKQFTYKNGIASNTAAKLNRFGFQVIEVDNDTVSREKTTITVYGTGVYTKTIETLGLFIPNEEIQISEEESEYDVVISLGNDYIDKIGNEPFNFYK